MDFNKRVNILYSVQNVYTVFLWIDPPHPILLFESFRRRIFEFSVKKRR
jgi:hypothetical protein